MVSTSRKSPPVPRKCRSVNASTETTAHTHTLIQRESLPISRWRNRYSSTSGAATTVMRIMSTGGACVVISSSAAWLALVCASPMRLSTITFTTMHASHVAGSSNSFHHVPVRNTRSDVTSGRQATASTSTTRIA